VTVVGVDPATVIVDGGDRSRIFDVSPLATGIVIRGMTIRNGTDLSGGGVRVTTGALTLDRVIVEDNDSNAAGGGISAGGLDSRLVIQDSIIRNNRAPFFSGDGGGIDASGELTVERTSITGNRATGAGGGLRATGNVVVRRSTISGNTASGSVLANGGGISASGLRLEESTVSGNTSASQGGGVFASGTLINSTISGNTSSTSGGGVSTSGTLSLLHVTVASNSATVGGGGLHRFGSTSSLTVRNTLLANSGTECAGLAPTSLGNNLSRDASCGLTATGDRSSTGAALNGLADNGGPTRTHLPMAGSPAINGAASAGLTTDQRGQPRPRGVRPDIGAVERE
jgi:predicted outer membrane repeat protein